MPNYKNARHGEDIHRELTAIFRSLKDPRIYPMLSIVRTELSRDGSSCKVYVSSMEGPQRAEESVKGLKSAAGFIRREVGLWLAMRHTPEFHFIADNSIEYGVHISRLLREIVPEDGETEEKQP